MIAIKCVWLLHELDSMITQDNHTMYENVYGSYRIIITSICKYCELVNE